MNCMISCMPWKLLHKVSCHYVFALLSLCKPHRYLHPVVGDEAERAPYFQNTVRQYKHFPLSNLWFTFNILCWHFSAIQVSSEKASSLLPVPAAKNEVQH